MVSGKAIPAVAATAILFLSGCSHQVILDDSHHYTIEESTRSEPMVAVISEEEIERQERTRAFTTGLAHGWDAEPGVMLEQVTRIEMPQMFEIFEIRRLPTDEPSTFNLELAIPEYEFSNYHASVTVDARLLSPDNETLLEESYSGSGPSGAGRMWAAGAFAMKSAMRNSTLGALQEVFESLRKDLNEILDTLSNGRPEASD